MHAYDPLDPGSNLGGGDGCFLFLMSKESDSKSHYIGIITFYLGLYSFIILWSSAVSAVKVNLGNWSLSIYYQFLFPCILLLFRHRNQLEVRL